MPYCKNDKSVYYNGKEPSPKGKGYCARATKLNTVKYGTDGKRWIVKKNSNGSKKWVKYITKSNVKRKIRKTNKTTSSRAVVPGNSGCGGGDGGGFGDGGGAGGLGGNGGGCGDPI